jgi:hypothetical protein
MVVPAYNSSYFRGRRRRIAVWIGPRQSEYQTLSVKQTEKAKVVEYSPQEVQRLSSKQEAFGSISSTRTKEKKKRKVPTNKTKQSKITFSAF